MKRLQILIDQDTDTALERKARSEGKSRAALIRQYLRERVKPLPPLKADPLWWIVGADDYKPKSIDAVVYR